MSRDVAGGMLWEAHGAHLEAGGVPENLVGPAYKMHVTQLTHGCVRACPGLQNAPAGLLQRDSEARLLGFKASSTTSKVWDPGQVISTECASWAEMRTAVHISWGFGQDLMS